MGHSFSARHLSSCGSPEHVVTCCFSCGVCLVVHPTVSGVGVGNRIDSGVGVLDKLDSGVQVLKSLLGYRWSKGTKPFCQYRAKLPRGC